jgi:hypothetical protein
MATDKYENTTNLGCEITTTEKNNMRFKLSDRQKPHVPLKHTAVLIGRLQCFWCVSTPYLVVIGLLAVQQQSEHASTLVHD